MEQNKKFESGRSYAWWSDSAPWQVVSRSGSRLVLSHPIGGQKSLLINEDPDGMEWVRPVAGETSKLYACQVVA